MNETSVNSLQACLLIYDIPERSEVANPSPRLRRMAVRVNLSCWVIREGDIPYHLLNEMAQGGATWHVVRFDAGESEKLIGMAREALIRDIRAAMKRANSSADGATRKLEAGENTTETRAQFIERVKPIVRRVNKLLADTRKVAERFGIDPAALSLADAATALQAIQSGMYARAQAYAEAAEQVRKLGDAAMANAAAADLVPAGIMADDIDERGGNAGALRDAFSVN
jgi:hypothetical protein